MGKNFGTNSKAEEGRARKAAAKEAEKEKQRQEKQKQEDKKWEQGTKDESRRQAEEAKRLEKLIKKQELRAIEAQEQRELEKFKPAKNKNNNLKVPETQSSTIKSPTLNWSLSRSVSDDGSSLTGSTEAFSASNIDDALLLLESTNASSSSMNVEKHPERRVKAAFAVFEARELPILKAENPTLRHTQLMERLHKMWQKAPENPFNQLHVAHNVTREEQARIVQEDIDRNLDRLRINWFCANPRFLLHWFFILFACD